MSATIEVVVTPPVEVGVNAPAVVSVEVGDKAGPRGPAGPGVPVGGTTNQVLGKASDDDFDTEWVDQSGGTGGGAVDSVNGQTGVVVLSASDVGADTAGARDAAIGVETARAESAESAAVTASAAYTDTQVASETSRATASEGAIAGNLAAEVIRAEGAESTLTAAVTAESTARQNADAAEVIARDAAIAAAVAGVVGGAPGALDTLKELADAINDDASFAATVTSALAGKQPLDADLTAIAALSTTAFGRAFLTMADAAATKTALSLVKGDVGLGNVDNTSDANKPVSTAQAAADTATLTSAESYTDTKITSEVSRANSAYDAAGAASTALAAAESYADTGDALALKKASNLSDLASASTARTNLGLGSLATVTPTGTPDGTKFLRDDDTWAAPSGGSSGGGLAIFGDGSDGTVTFDGTTAVLGMTPSSSTYTLARDLFLAAGTINSGVKIVTNNFRIFCAGTLTNNGTIKYNGNDASGSAAGAQIGNGNGTINTSNLVGKAGGAGGTSAGTSGTSSSPSLGGNGGHGGSGSAASGGASSSASVPSSGTSPIRWGGLLGVAVQGGSVAGIFGGAGGCGGGGDGTNAGGGGGGGGPAVVVAAKTFAGTGAIQARGGAGGTPATGNCGGGGGGGGGWVLVVSGSVSSGAIAGQTIDANGGAAGAKSGTATNNLITAGSNGTVILIPN